MSEAKAENVVLIASIVTMDADRPTAEALVLNRRTGTIVFVGSRTEARAGAWMHDAEEWDLSGSWVVPGFNDCHMHILPYGLDLVRADLSPEAGVLDNESLVRALVAWRARNVDQEWVIGSRYNQNLFPGACHPTRHDLDRAFPHAPVYILQTSKHAAACNSLALRLAGIHRDTPDPAGGEIVRDAAGEPTGVLLESAMDLVARLLPRPDRSGLTRAVERAVEALWKKGITAASDLNTGWHSLSEEIAAYREAIDSGHDLRITLFPHAPGFGDPEDVPARDDFARGHAPEFHGNLRLGPVKLFADGALTVRTAALRIPYIDGSGSGMLLHAPDELKAYVRSAHRKGWQIAIHAIGDRAIELVLDAYLEAARCNPDAWPAPQRRHRIEHAMLLDEALLQRVADQSVVPVIQPEFLSRLGDAYILGLGEERAALLNPVASLSRHGVCTPFSSDCPIVPGSPLDGMRAAVRRQTASGRTLGPEERIGPLEALRNYTWAAAYSTHDETACGKLAVGMRADLAVLSHEPTSDEGLAQARVEATLVAGKVVYRA